MCTCMYILLNAIGLFEIKFNNLLNPKLNGVHKKSYNGSKCKDLKIRGDGMAVFNVFFFKL